MTAVSSTPKSIQIPSMFGLRAGIMLVMMLLFCSASARAQGSDAVGEYQVKAAFLYHFAKFVEWPPAAWSSQSTEVCILGSDPFGSSLDRLLQDKTLRGKAFAVRRIANASEAVSCHIVFVSMDDKNALQESLTILSDSPVLTVGDSTDFSDAGGMVYLFVERSKVRFDINLEAAKQSGLRISSQLLRLARNVK